MLNNFKPYSDDSMNKTSHHHLKIKLTKRVLLIQKPLHYPS